MIKRFVIILALLGMATSSAQAITFTDMKVLTDFCALAYTDHLKTGDTKLLQETLNQLPKEGQPALLLACYAYSEGYKSGKKAADTRMHIT